LGPDHTLGMGEARHFKIGVPIDNEEYYRSTSAGMIDLEGAVFVVTAGSNNLFT